MMWDWHDGSWGWWLVMWFGMLAFWAAVVWIAVAVLRANRATRTDAESVLAERFARGEIDVDEYRTRLEVLRGGDTDRRAA